MALDSPTFIDVAGRRIAVRARLPVVTGAPTILFLPGYASDMMGAKALALDALAEARGCAMVRFDYSGTGESPGDFAEGTLDRWTQDALGVIDAMAPSGLLIVCGSSMGGWIALHVALRRRDRVAALVGIAAAPDFTDWGFSADEKDTIARDGVLISPSDYGDPMRTFLPFWESGVAMRLLDAPIDVTIPVRLIHGDADPDVPPAIAHRLVAALRSADVQLTLVKGGGHRLSAPHELAAITGCVGQLLESV